MKTNKFATILIAALTLTVVFSGTAFAAPVEQTFDPNPVQINPFLEERLQMMETNMNNLVAAGKITQEEANQFMETQRARIEAQLQNVGDVPFGGGRGMNFRNMTPGMGMQYRQNMGNRFQNMAPGGMGMQYRQNIGDGFQNTAPGMGMGSQGNGIQLRLQDGTGTNCYEDCPYYQNQP